VYRCAPLIGQQKGAILLSRSDMPIFEYQCSKCGHAFEELVFNTSEGEGVRCPSCKSRKLSKLMSAFASGNSAALPCAPSAGCDPGRSCDPGSFS